MIRPWDCKRTPIVKIVVGHGQPEQRALHEPVFGHGAEDFVDEHCIDDEGSGRDASPTRSGPEAEIPGLTVQVANNAVCATKNQAKTLATGLIGEKYVRW